MFELIRRLFGDRRAAEPTSPSGGQAKERLKILLVHDRASVVPDALPALKGEIIAVISKYMDIDTQAMHIDVAREQGSVALRANIPILSWKKRPDHEVDL